MALSGTVVMEATQSAVPADAPPLVTLPADVRNVLLLGDRRAVPVRLAEVDVEPSATDVVLMTEPPIVLRTDRQELVSTSAFSGQVTGFENDVGHRHVQLAMPDTRSGTQLVFVWNLDDPCAGPVPSG